MANTAANVVAGKPLATGGVLIGATTATGPADATTTPTGFTASGYVGEDGVTESNERSTDRIRAWGGDTVKVVQTEHNVTYAFTFLETLNTDVLKAVYGDDNVTPTAATSTVGKLHTVLVNAATLPHKSFVFEVKDGDAKIRIYIPDGQITEVGEITYSDSEVVGYQVTIEAFADASGNKAYKYMNDGKPSVTGIPTLNSALPSAAATGDQVVIKGAKFTGTTAITFGAVSVVEWIVLDSATIVAVMPAGTAGSAAVTVTNASGASAPLAYTRG
jgi:hypothetical protein